MGILISTSNQEKLYNDKNVIHIGTNPKCDFLIQNLGCEVILTLQYSEQAKKCMIVNRLNTNNILFKGQPIPQKMIIDNMCKLMINGTNEFIKIKIADNAEEPAMVLQAAASAGTTFQEAPQEKTLAMIGNEDLNESDIKELYGEKSNAATKIKIEKRKADIEEKRVGILKEIGFTMDDLKKKIDANITASRFSSIALFIMPFITSILVSDTLKTIIITQGEGKAAVPEYMKGLLIFSAFLLGMSIALKQGVFLYLQNKSQRITSKTTKTLENILIAGSLVGFVVLYVIIVALYMRTDIALPLQTTLIGVMGCGVAQLNAIYNGFLKYNQTAMAIELDKHESREDFQKVMQEYQQWIFLYINNFSRTKIEYIKNKLFNLQLKSVGEIILGILTAPFLAYGVSNTLAMCFPEAAGWIRISGLRFSPVFLTLSTFLIIFAFFSLTASFLCTRKSQASEVIRKDGFSNFQQHGVELYGSEGIKKLNGERSRSFAIASSIIFIEFSMNISYFVTEIGGDWQGLFLSIVAALVPTALLIAETYMLSETQFEIFAHEELIAKLDKDI